MHMLRILMTSLSDNYTSCSACVDRVFLAVCMEVDYRGVVVAQGGAKVKLYSKSLNITFNIVSRNLPLNAGI